MTDPEVARLRRLRGEALRVRAIARALGSTQWAANDKLFSRGALASWRIARIVSGRLKAHPYLRYQKGVGLGSLTRNRLAAAYLALTRKDRVAAFREFESQLNNLVRHLDDTRALSWSSEFSDSLGRSQYEISSVLDDVAQVTNSKVALTERLARKTSRPDTRVGAGTRVGELAQTLEGDWPYLAF